MHDRLRLVWVGMSWAWFLLVHGIYALAALRVTVERVPALRRVAGWLVG